MCWKSEAILYLFSSFFPYFFGQRKHSKTVSFQASAIYGQTSNKMRSTFTYVRSVALLLYGISHFLLLPHLSIVLSYESAAMDVCFRGYCYFQYGNSNGRRLKRRTNDFWGQFPQCRNLPRGEISPSHSFYVPLQLPEKKKKKIIKEKGDFEFHSRICVIKTVYD